MVFTQVKAQCFIMLAEFKLMAVVESNFKKYVRKVTSRFR
jgi:hypothetical protein